MVISIQTLCSGLSKKPFERVQPGGFLGMTQHVFHTWIWGSSPAPSGGMLNVGGQTCSGLSRDAPLGLGQVYHCRLYIIRCNEGQNVHITNGYIQ